MRKDLKNIIDENKAFYDELYDILTEYNSRFNLTAIKGKEDYLTKHVADSLLGLPYAKGKLLDIGSGAGFPALVLKKQLPTLDVTMVDSVGKKVNYLNTVINKFGMNGIKALHCRIEDIGERAVYDTVTARAVARMNVLAEYALPFLKIGGTFVAYKADDCGEELQEAEKAIKLLGGKIEKIVREELDENTVRKIVIVKKIKQTPPAYPRKNNKPRISPII